MFLVLAVLGFPLTRSLFASRWAPTPGPADSVAVATNTSIRQTDAPVQPIVRLWKLYAGGASDRSCANSTLQKGF